MTHGMKRFPTTVDVANISASSAGRERPTKIDALTAAVLASTKLFHWTSVPHFSSPSYCITYSSPVRVYNADRIRSCDVCF